MSELKRPERCVNFESIKPELREITEFYTRKVKDYLHCLKQLNEYADALENEIQSLKETPKVEVLLDDTAETSVVPQLMADWFENQLKNNESKKFDGNDVFRIIQDVIKVSNDESTWEDYGITDEIVKFAEDNEELFLNLIVNCSLGYGYTVECEQLYEIRLPLPKNDDNDYALVDVKGYIWEDALPTKYKLTESEIKAIDERYWTFAVPVEEVEP